MTYDVIVLLNRQRKTHRKLTCCYIMLKLQATALCFSLLFLWWFSQQTPQTTSRLNFVHSPCLDRHRSQTNTVLVSAIFPSSVMWRTNFKYLGQAFRLFSCRLPWMKTNQNMTESSGPILEDCADHQITSHQSFVYRRLSGCVGLSY